MSSKIKLLLVAYPSSLVMKVVQVIEALMVSLAGAGLTMVMIAKLQTVLISRLVTGCSLHRLCRYPLPYGCSVLVSSVWLVLREESRHNHIMLIDVC